MHDRKPYIVLIGRVITSDGPVLKGRTALLTDKDGLRLMGRGIVEPSAGLVPAAVRADTSKGFHNGLPDDPEQRRAALVDLIAQFDIDHPLLAIASDSDRTFEVGRLPITPNADNPESLLQQTNADTSTEPPQASDPEQRLAAIMGAIGQLDPATESNWLKSGAPDVKALEGLLGFSLTAAERDAAWHQRVDDQTKLQDEA